jgi:chitodextrinase
MTGGSNRRARLSSRVRQQLQTAALAFASLVIWACSDTPIPTATDRRPTLNVAPQGGPNDFVGRYVIRHGDDFANHKGTFEPVLEVDDSTMLTLDFGTGKKPKLDPGVRMRVRGTRKGNSLAVEDGTAAPLPTTPGLAAIINGTTDVSLSPRTKRIAVVLLNFSDNATQPYTLAYASGVAFTNTSSVAAYYKSNSWDAVTLTGDVYGWFTIPDAAAAGCNYTAWAASVKTLATAAGIDLSSAKYENVVYGFPNVSSCGWSGLAYLPGRESWLNGTGGMSLRTMGHELGHNFATHHASTMNCTEGGVRVTLSANSANCTSVEYGDPFSIMGSGSRRHSNASLANFGWLPAANRFDVVQSGDYQLAPLYSAAGYQSLRVQRTSSSYFALEYRQSGPFDTFNAGDPAISGVTVRLTGSDANRIQSQLLDMTPSTTTFNDAPLLVGNTFVDPLTSVAMTTLATSTAGADVRIAFAPDQSPPSQPGNFKATAMDANRIALSWSASTDNTGVSGYRITRNSTVLPTVTGTSYTDAGLSASTAYSYQIVALDTAGNVSSAAAASATTMTLDAVPPSTPTGLTAKMAKGGKFTLTWNASTDNIAVVGYRVYKNGQLAATVTMNAYNGSIGGGKNVSAASFYVIAFDAAGNSSGTSSLVTVGG